MKDVIIPEKAQEKEKQLAIRNVDKIAQVEVARTSRPMDLDGKYIWAINNIDIEAVRDLRLTSIKKYWRLAGQIKKEVNGLYRD